jgi:hypothetical protein
MRLLPDGGGWNIPVSRRLTPPHRLQQGTPYEQIMPLFNDNMENLVNDLKGFAVEDVLEFPLNTLVGIIPAGGLDHFVFAAISSTVGDDVVFMIPQVSVYIDYAPAGPTGFSNDYLFPTGSAITAGMLKTVVTSFVCMTNSTAPPFTGTDGSTYYFANEVVVSIRNADVVDHTYVAVVNESVYTKSNSFYR